MVYQFVHIFCVLELILVSFVHIFCEVNMKHELSCRIRAINISTFYVCACN